MFKEIVVIAKAVKSAHDCLEWLTDWFAEDAKENYSKNVDARGEALDAWRALKSIQKFFS